MNDGSSLTSASLTSARHCFSILKALLRTNLNKQPSEHTSMGNCLLPRMVWVGLAFASLMACRGQTADETPQGELQDTRIAAVVTHYADMAQVKFADAHQSARTLRIKIEAMLAAPGPESHVAAKVAWRDARIPYLQSEVYRFGNAIVDRWEGRVNSWPLDEGLIDYVASGEEGDRASENRYSNANIIANAELTVGGKSLSTATLDQALLRSLHELDEVEANVTTGYHAIEFLLWGQDLNGTGVGAGQRPWTDFENGPGCTGGHCGRRRDYLMAAVDLLIEDLEIMARSWQAGGEARRELLDAPPPTGLRTMLTGMGSLSYGELAGERMRLGLMLHDPEEEQDCFADNTHQSHFYNARGIRNVYLGQYDRGDGRSQSGTVLSGPALSDIVRDREPELDRTLRDRLESTEAAMAAIRDSAESGAMAYDQMLAAENPSGNALIQDAIDALTAQTETIEQIVAALNLVALELQGSDSLDNPSAVFQ